MSEIGKNIKKIRSTHKLSQAQMAELFNLARPSIGAYEEGRAEPKIDTLIQISKKFNVSLDGLINEELSFNDLMQFNTINEKLEKAHRKIWEQTPDVTKSKVSDAILFIPIHAYSDYQIMMKKRDLHSKFESISLPKSFSGEARVFEMNGSEMEYQQHGIHHGDLILGQRVDLKSLITGKIYTMVTDQVIFTRRINKINDSHVIMESDDPNYSLIDLPLKTIEEAWQVAGVFSTYLEPPRILEERVMILEKKLSALENRLKP